MWDMEHGSRGSINHCNNDILQNILGRLPALTFANAACVSKTWYRICSIILSRPKLASALSLNPSLIGAVGEVLAKVLSKPIRPHFAMAYISEQFGLRGAFLLLSRRLGRKTPLVTHIGNGVMGIDTRFNELREVKWDYFNYTGPHPREANGFSDVNQGIVLVVGYVPGLKVDAIPLFHPKANHGICMVEEFVRNIKAYSFSVSNSESPSAIIMFGDRKSDMNTIVATMDNEMGKETVMVGDGGGCFLFNSVNYRITHPWNSYILDAVALVFAEDKHKPQGIGETVFHVQIAGGLVPFGPRFEVIGVGLTGRRTCMSASLEGFHLVLNFQAVMDTILETVNDRNPDLYIGVAKSRNCCSRGTTFPASIAYYQVLGGEGNWLVIDGAGVQPGDNFLFYHRDLQTARATNATAYMNLNNLRRNLFGSEDAVFGGLIFSCNSRGQSYFGRPHADIIPFSLNFPHAPVAGVFCKGEIGCASSSSSSVASSSSVQEQEEQQEWEEESPDRFCVHACSAVYLTMCYLPPLSLHH